ncbi:hypothetical protein [Bradyrhizobium sp. LMG 9283]|uniref:hypothetical protein n=1 Tax=Bradyrhizobium sp. LMG 9283 TaxID=592064 RepID=UPI00388E6168
MEISAADVLATRTRYSSGRVKASVFKRIFDAASDDADMEFVTVDATVVKIQGAKAETQNQAVGKSKAVGPQNSSR